MLDVRDAERAFDVRGFCEIGHKLRIQLAACKLQLAQAECNWRAPAAQRERDARKFRIRLPVVQGHWTDDEVVHRHVDSLDVRRRFDLASNDGFQRHFRAGQQQGVDSIERHAGGRLVCFGGRSPVRCFRWCSVGRRGRSKRVIVLSPVVRDERHLWTHQFKRVEMDRAMQQRTNCQVHANCLGGDYIAPGKPLRVADVQVFDHEPDSRQKRRPNLAKRDVPPGLLFDRTGDRIAVMVDIQNVW